MVASFVARKSRPGSAGWNIALRLHLVARRPLSAGIVSRRRRGGRRKRLPPVLPLSARTAHPASSWPARSIVASEADSPADRGVPDRNGGGAARSPLKRPGGNAGQPGMLSGRVDCSPEFAGRCAPVPRRTKSGGKQLSRRATTAARERAMATLSNRWRAFPGTDLSPGEACRPTRCATGAISFSERVRPVVPDASLGKHEGARAGLHQQRRGWRTNRAAARRGAARERRRRRDRAGQRPRSLAGARGNEARRVRTRDLWIRWRLRP